MKKLISISVIFLFFYCSFAQTERRFQIWNKNEFVIQPWNKFAIDVAQKIHYSPKNNNTDLLFGEMFLFHKPVDWINYGAGYRVAYANIFSYRIQENRTMLIVNFKKDFNNYNFKFSNRFEHRAYKTDINHFRYKQQLTLTFPALTSWGMQFYASEESFYKFNGIGTHLARFYGGLSGIQKEHFQLKIYYALEKYKIIESWATTDIMGLNLSITI